MAGEVATENSAKERAMQRMVQRLMDERYLLRASVETYEAQKVQLSINWGVDLEERDAASPGVLQ